MSPCPFCAGVHCVAQLDDDGYAVECTRCLARGPVVHWSTTDTPNIHRAALAEATRRWNERIKP